MALFLLGSGEARVDNGFVAHGPELSSAAAERKLLFAGLTPMAVNKDAFTPSEILGAIPLFCCADLTRIIRFINGPSVVA